MQCGPGLKSAGADDVGYDHQLLLSKEELIPLHSIKNVVYLSVLWTLIFVIYLFSCSFNVIKSMQSLDLFIATALMIA